MACRFTSGKGFKLGVRDKPTITQIKIALRKVYKELDIKKPLKKSSKGTGPKSTPRAGGPQKGYRLDPPHIGAKHIGKEKPYWHIDWWKGKRKSGKTGTVEIE